MGRYFWPRPPLTPEPNKTRMQFLTQEKQDHEPGLAVQPLAWVHRKVAVLGSFLHSELSSLGYAGAWPDFLAPTPEPGKPPFLYFLYPFPYSPLMWTRPAGTPSTCNSFLSAADYDPCLQALSPFSLICPGKVGRSSIWFLMGMQGKVGWHDRWRCGAGMNTRMK